MQRWQRTQVGHKLESKFEGALLARLLRREFLKSQRGWEAVDTLCSVFRFKREMQRGDLGRLVSQLICVVTSFPPASATDRVAFQTVWWTGSDGVCGVAIVYAVCGGESAKWMVLLLFLWTFSIAFYFRGTVVWGTDDDCWLGWKEKKECTLLLLRRKRYSWARTTRELSRSQGKGSAFDVEDDDAIRLPEKKRHPAVYHSESSCCSAEGCMWEGTCCHVLHWDVRVSVQRFLPVALCSEVERGVFKSPLCLVAPFLFFIVCLCAVEDCSRGDDVVLGLKKKKRDTVLVFSSLFCCGRFLLTCGWHAGLYILRSFW